MGRPAPGGKKEGEAAEEEAEKWQTALHCLMAHSQHCLTAHSQHCLTDMLTGPPLTLQAHMNGSALTSSVFPPKTVQASTAHSPAEHSTPVTRLNFVNVDESPPKAPRRTSARLPAITDGMLDYVGFQPIVCGRDIELRCGASGGRRSAAKSG